MPRIDNSIEIKAPPETVFEYASDVSRYPEWVKWAKQAEKTSTEWGLGATDVMTIQVGPKKRPIEEIVTEYKPGEFITRRTTSGMKMTDRLTVVPRGETSVVAWSVEYTPPMGGMGKLLDVLFMEKLFDQLMEDSLTQLKERLERAS